MASTSEPLQPAGKQITCKLLDVPVLDDHVIASLLFLLMVVCRDTSGCSLHPTHTSHTVRKLLGQASTTSRDMLLTPIS